MDVKELIYPLFIPLEKNGLFAYSTRFMVKSEDLSKVEDLVERYYHKENMQEKEHLYDHGKYFVTINLTIFVLFLLIV